jgi:hypothetical protein
MKATFEHSVSVLTKAYLNNTLINGNCWACAVGNLVADSLGLQILIDDDIHWGKVGETREERAAVDGERQPLWYNCMMNNRVYSNQYNYTTIGTASMAQIANTGYSLSEVTQIENAFESARLSILEEDQDLETRADLAKRDERVMYQGLLAVVDVLAKIHGVELVVNQSAVTGFEQIHQTRATALVNS